jgi:hypothetical protein
MGGRQTTFAVALAIALLSSTHLLASRRPWTPDTMRRSVQYSDLVVRGMIKLVSTENVPDDGKQYPSTVLQLTVSEVIKGAWKSPEIKVVLVGTAELGTVGVTYDYVAGDEVILCLRFDPDAMGGIYRFWGDSQSYVNRSGSWKTRHGNSVSIDDVRAAARQTDPGVMAREADAVLVGTVQSVELRTLNHDGSSTAGDDDAPRKPTADYVRVLATDGFKGASAGDSLLVRVLRRGSQLDWWADMPALQAGKSYLMFLKWDGIGYYSFRGFNGFLEARNDQLMLNDHASYPLRRPQVDAEVEKALKPR